MSPSLPLPGVHEPCSASAVRSYVVDAVTRLPVHERLTAEEPTQRRSMEHRTLSLVRQGASLSDAWLQSLQTWRRGTAAVLGSRRALQQDLGDRAGEEDEADVRRLARQVQEVLPRIEAELGDVSVGEDVAESRREADGMYELDARLSVALGRLGREGSDLRHSASRAADRLAQHARRRWEAREGGERPWDRWRDPTHVAWNVALVLWVGDVKEVSRRVRLNPPALTAYVQSSFAAVMSPGAKLVEQSGQAIVLARDGNVVAPLRGATSAGMDWTAMRSVLEVAVRDAGGLDTHRMLRFMVNCGHEQWAAGVADPRRHDVDGGYEGLAVSAQCIGKKAAEKARALVQLLAHWRFTGMDGSEFNMLAYKYRPAAPGRRALLTLVYGDALLPQYHLSLPGSALMMREARRLIPICSLPPLANPHDLYGAQATFQLLLLAYFRERAKELHLTGGVRVDLLRLQELGVRAGVPANSVQRVIDCWVSGNDSTPPFLERLEVDRFTLSNAHRDAREFLRKAGEMEHEGSVRGRAEAGGRKRAGKQ